MQAFMVLPLVIAVVVVGLRTGGIRALLALRLRHRWLVGASVAVQFLRQSNPGWANAVLSAAGGTVPVTLIWLLVTAFAATNFLMLPSRARAAMAIFIVGMTMNTLAIAANGGMPFSLGAAKWAGMTDAEIEKYVPGHPPLTTDSRLAPLADVLPVPGVHAVASIGDLLIIGGLTWLLIAIMLQGIQDPAVPASVRRDRSS
ncbi:DUF5317 family protein [Micromonospora sp. LH3U1]|uniref:DUF5317 family protein n=1 Tax=Micromonospora sp. LH3U1 TaxID=3018339 RepID=UPI00234BAA6C|nr:DUF5317 family protein [Micromonospora sp. LH3U1]WCN79457.1 DUF5317 family protein [Micromonospora sp. LH3U1]